MTTVTLGISTVEEAKGRMRRAFQGEAQGAFIGFKSPELLWKVITLSRLELLRLMIGIGPVTIRELSRRLERDVTTIHRDVQALLKAGVIDRAKDDRIVFPYDSIHVDFVVSAA